MKNPMLNQGALPHFSCIQPAQIAPTLRSIIDQNRATLKELLNKSTEYTWDNLLAPIEEMNDRLGKMWAPVSHLHSVAETEELRAAYNDCLPMLTEYGTELMQNETFYAAVKSIAEGPQYAKLTEAQRKIISNELRDFKLSGVLLSPTDKARFGELQKQLSKLTTQFAENVLDATQGWMLHITEIESLKGLSEDALKMAEQNAKARDKTGWVFTLEYPSYITVMKYLDNRELRRLVYEAYATRASNQGPDAGKWDNSQTMEGIIKVRQEMAKLIGYPNFAEYSLATKMADSPKRVLGFLQDLVSRSKPYAESEIKELENFSKKLDGIEHLEAWDLTYYSEKLRQSTFDLSQEELRPYFPADKVMQGMFDVVEKLYGMKVTELTEVDTWNPQVQVFEIKDTQGKPRGFFYTDLYARAHKREGAWMDDARSRRLLADGTLQIPVAFLTCNFNRPLGNHPALLTHDEVLTLFHEFGHCLHHLLTQVDYAGVSGLNGVAWDAVEFPSQFFELFCWNKDILKLISGHFETGQPLPDALFNKLKAARDFQPGMHMLKQLEYSIFDFRIHSEYGIKQEQSLQQILDEVRDQASVVKTPSFNRFQHSFSHIFAGGYAAGYYSYKWAEVLSSDAFATFEEKENILDPEKGRQFLEAILEQGGTREPMELFVMFRGREPSIDALLRHSGLAETHNKI